MTGGEIVAIIALTGTVVTTLVAAIFQGAAMSRCKKISCCCFECDREVLQNEDLYNTKRENDDEN